ncbi:hypothetical protein [Streptomyces griseofuscus]|uniref:hypothetical protein n=1 Tax=Streptomyces griseofuscus TaxID=146922 RepID=UPI0036A0B0BC
MTTIRDWSWVRHWTELLQHDEVWCDAQGRILRLDDMDPGYCGRVRSFVLRQAEDVYNLIGMQACAGPDDLSDTAQVAFDRAFDDFLSVESPKEWLEQSPLVVALKRRSEGLPARGSAPQACSSASSPSADDDPFGPYEYVEPDDRCQGAEGNCEPFRGPAQCTQRASTCRCMCPVCCGDTPDVWGAPVY